MSVSEVWKFQRLWNISASVASYLESNRSMSLICELGPSIVLGLGGEVPEENIMLLDNQGKKFSHSES